MRIFFIGDIYARPGRQVVRDHLADIVARERIDLVVANGENAAAGFGLTPALADELLGYGIAVLTTGNHVWDQKELAAWWTQSEAARDEVARRVLRPANYPAPLPGRGLYCGEVRGEPYAVLNLQGRIFMTPLDCPFQTADRLLATLDPACKTILVDMHAEATSEKQALGWYLDGRVTAVLGTHTHVPTADERVLAGGTAFQTDVGMTGAFAGVIGARREEVLRRLLTGYPVRLEPAEGDVRLCGCIIESEEGRARSIERFQLGSTDP